MPQTIWKCRNSALSSAMSCAPFPRTLVMVSINYTNTTLPLTAQAPLWIHLISNTSKYWYFEPPLLMISIHVWRYREDCTNRVKRTPDTLEPISSWLDHSLKEWGYTLSYNELVFWISSSVRMFHCFSENWTFLLAPVLNLIYQALPNWPFEFSSKVSLSNEQMMFY